MTLILAHRGAHQIAPENSIAAFRAAQEWGANGVELDVQLSRDDEIVVIHDLTVDRVSNGQGRVRDLTLAELQSLDLGAGERIPTLQEVVTALAPRMFFNIELKSSIIQNSGLERRVARLIAHNNMYKRVIVSSFNPLVVWRIKRIDSRIKTGLLYAPTQPVYLRRAWLRLWVKPDALHPHHSMVDVAYMRWAKSNSYAVNVWAVDDAERCRELTRLGVDAIITDGQVGKCANDYYIC